MNPFSDNFLNYEENPLDFDKLRETDFSLTSPNSDSTAFYGNSVSPPQQQYYHPHDQLQENFYGYNEEFMFSTDYQAQLNTGGIENVYTKAEVDEKKNNKNKRTMKRQIAKERTKTKQDYTAFLEGVDSKFLPEGFDDPNLDEKTKKRMVQMVRNRISAQNSRDRKKVHMMKLEDINTKLVQEKDALIKERTNLIDEMQRLQQANHALYEENQTLKNGNICSLCRRAQNGETYQNEDENQIASTEDSLTGGFSGLNSPVLQRFASGGRGFMTFFAFAAFVSLIVVMNVQQNPGFVPDSKPTLQGPRFLEDNNHVCKNPADMPEIKIDTKSLDESYSLLLRNIKPIKDNFDSNSKATFMAHLEKTMTLTEVQPDINVVLPSQEPEFQNAIVYSDYFKSSNLRGKMPTLMARNLPIVSQTLGENPNTSTLFCHKGMEFFEAEENDIQLNEDGSSGIGYGQLNLNTSLDLEKADYLQLLVPRHSISRYDVNGNLSGLYGIPDPTNGDPNAVLEVWCKVFYVRELSPTF